MKIEIGESLFYSWLRHVQECQLVQTNWKASPKWELKHKEDLQNLMDATDRYFEKNHFYRIFKQNASLSQILQQGECDVLGISVQEGSNSFYAVDVAFHEAGLNYGSREVTVMKVLAKIIRSAMCLWGYFESREAELIFASPKINSAVMNELEPCVNELSKIFIKQGYNFRTRIIANDEFRTTVLNPILTVSGGIADTTELFLRSYQLYTMFIGKNDNAHEITGEQIETGAEYVLSEFIDEKVYQELKPGQLARTVFKQLLEDGKASEEEILSMQRLEFSKEIFQLSFPVLVKEDGIYDKERYYSNSIDIRGEKYKLCSQWYKEKNQTPLIEWIKNHSN